MKKLLYLLFVLPSLLFSQWMDITDKIYGDKDADLFGWATAINDEGDVIAVSALMDYNADSGYVKVLQKVNDEWIQVGETIINENIGNENGYALALNAEGTIVAVTARYEGSNVNGVTRVYELLNGEWMLLGEPILGSNNSSSGDSIALNASGTILAVGSANASSPANSSGEIRIYQYDGVSWEQLGSNIAGESSFHYFGYSVGLNATGDILVGGAQRGNSNSSGYVKAYRFQNGEWQQLGQKINGIELGAQFGKRVAINNEGNIIAGLAGANSTQNSIGYARIYKLNNNSWIQKGNTIVQTEVNDFLYASGFDLNGNGNVLAIGAYGNNGSADYFGGKVTVYQLLNDSWDIVGEKIEGDVTGSGFGRSIGLNNYGNILVSGAPFPFANDPEDPLIGPGFVRVLNTDDIVLDTNKNNLESIVMFPNPTNGIFQVTINPSSVLKATVFDALGRKIDVLADNTPLNMTFDISEFQVGLYLSLIHI